MRWIRRLLALLGLGLLALAMAMGVSQWDIRTLEPDPPDPAAVLALDGASDRPVRLHWIETARQVSVAPPPDVISHPSFVLEWTDGRLLLVDLGMSPAGARAFSEPFEALGGDPPETFGSVAEHLGSAVDRVAGVVITHLHIDHVEGGVSLCRARGGAVLPLFQVAAQAERRNFTTRPSDAYLEEAGCLQSNRLDAASPTPLPGFPGVALIHAAGHTPGSQMVVASLDGPGGTERWAFPGDVINDAAAAAEDRPKSLLYRLLIVPEHDRQLSRMRRFLAGLAQAHGATLAPAHDGNHLAGLGIPPFRSP